MRRKINEIIVKIKKNINGKKKGSLLEVLVVVAVLLIVLYPLYEEALSDVMTQFSTWVKACVTDILG